jgi:alanyl-tRNA synthetase
MCLISQRNRAMPTERLYYTDAYTKSFEAELIEVTLHEGRAAVVLDRSYFYPTSGGQPHDTGNLNGLPVTDVVLREPDKVVLHVVDGEPVFTGARIAGQIDWPRRFDHMRHHTGQHILSQAFVELAGADTVGFHLSPDSVTIDLNKTSLDGDLIDAVEDLSNQIIADDRPVRAYFPSADEFAALRLRKVPDVEGDFRVVDIEGFDTNACGGTHVHRTGEIGVIKILRADRRGDTTRVEFRCGDRALLDYRQKHALLSQIAADLTTGYDQIPAILAKLREENKALHRDLRALQQIVLEQEAERLWQTADRSAGYALIVQAFDGRDSAEVRQIVQHLVAHPATIALCGAAGEKAQLIAARSDDLPQDMVAVLKRGLLAWGVDRGGGRPSFAQGGGPSVSLEQVQTALAAAAEMLGSSHR